MAQLTEEEFLEITNSQSPKKFSSKIEQIVSSNGVRYVDAIMEYCEDNNVDVDIVPKLITPPLRDKLHAEARRYNFLPKIGLLPI